jgi:small subunit ribosomal protein S4
MGGYAGSRNKLSRREGKDLFGTGGDGLERRLRQSRGEQARGRRRQSVYARQLREKQMVKRMYGVRERQFRRVLDMARRSSEPTDAALLKLLEQRLDNAVYRLGFARTRPQARQFVTHDHVSVDRRRVSIPSYLVKLEETIALGELAREIPDVETLQENPPLVPGWLERRTGAGRVLPKPEREEIDPDIDESRILAFYSR